MLVLILMLFLMVIPNNCIEIQKCWHFLQNLLNVWFVVFTRLNNWPYRVFYSPQCMIPPLILLLVNMRCIKTGFALIGYQVERSAWLVSSTIVYQENTDNICSLFFINSRENLLPILVKCINLHLRNIIVLKESRAWSYTLEFRLDGTQINWEYNT